ncbi:MAG: tetratricopeptide repeat protein [Nitrospira sp.]|nr:tetratricopeptide repeat protein [Nitrospira sp.]
MATRKTGRQAPRPAMEREVASRDVHTPGGLPPQGARSSTHTRVALNMLAALALSLLVAVCYYPATQGGFVWDDSLLMRAKPIQSPSGLWQVWFEPSTIDGNEAHYWPVLYTLFWLEHRLWGFTPAGFHIVNVLLHLGVTLLLWRLLLRLAVPGAWVVAMVFAIHPFHAESVSWVIGRKDPLASLFSLACVLAWLRFAEHGHRGNYAWALVWFVLGMLSKTTVVTLPVSLLIWSWWKQGRVTATDVARVAPLLLVGLGIMIAEMSYAKGRDHSAFDYSMIERMLIAAHALWFYVGKLVWPTGLAVIYPRWDIRVMDPLAWGYVVTAIAAVALLWAFRHRIGRGPLAGALFFAVTLSPTLGFVDYSYMHFSFVADRYQYLAGTGVIAVLVGAAAHGLSRLPGAWQTGTRVTAVALLVALLGPLTWHQAGIYRDEVTFYRHIISLNPKARFAHFMLGLEYNKQGRYEEALATCRIEYQLALQHPYDQTWNGWARVCMGNTTEKLGRLAEAETYYKSVQNFPEAFHRLTKLWMRQERYQEALELHRTFVRKNPWSARLHSGMGVALLKLNRLDEALQSFERALELAPSMEEARTHRDRVRQLLKNRGA